MSLAPYWFRHLRNLASRDPVSRAFEDPFLSVFARDPVKYLKALSEPIEQVEGIYSDHEIKVDGKKIEVHLDVKNFTPEQIQVKTVGNEIMVEGKKEIKKEDGWMRSHFERRFLLPEGFPPERVECHLDKGKLMLLAFRTNPLSERTVPIQEKSSEKKSSEKKSSEEKS